jgi:hypothetical protein
VVDFYLEKKQSFQKVADFYLGRAEFYKGWRVLTWRTQNFYLKEHVLGNEAEKFL